MTDLERAVMVEEEWGRRVATEPDKNAERLAAYLATRDLERCWRDTAAVASRVPPGSPKSATVVLPMVRKGRG